MCLHDPFAIIVEIGALFVGPPSEALRIIIIMYMRVNAVHGIKNSAINVLKIVIFYITELNRRKIN
jgi:hypothetical protein